MAGIKRDLDLVLTKGDTLELQNLIIQQNEKLKLFYKKITMYIKNNFILDDMLIDI